MSLQETQLKAATRLVAEPSAVPGELSSLGLLVIQLGRLYGLLTSCTAEFPSKRRFLVLFNTQFCWLIFLPRPDLWRTPALEGGRGWKKIGHSRCVSSTYPLLCDITIVPDHVQGLALVLLVTTSLEQSTVRLE